jgi:hypothetical protein
MWAAAPVHAGFQAVCDRLKLAVPICLNMQIPFEYCAGTAPGNAVIVVGFHCEDDGHQLESLILAQNERWRHA